jgi:TIR domain
VAKSGVARKSVFVSHISDETDIAQWLKAHIDRDFLGTLDIFVSSDRSTIAAGRKWLDEVDKALKQADLQIVLCSRDSVGRPWVNFEAGAVWLRGIPVVPVCHSGLDPAALPVPLSMLEGVSLTSAKGLEKLYDSVAGALGLRTPSIDFEALAKEAAELEGKSLTRGSRLDVVENPRVLCAASKQYAEPAYGFDLDVEVVERYFPKRVIVERELTSQRLMDLLTSERFDIVHLVTAVDPTSGAIIFDHVDEQSREAPTGGDLMMPSSFASLLVESQTRLVVLATCKALLLAVEVSNVANMAASDQDITGREAADWEDVFYRLLAQGKPVFKAFELTRQQRVTPIRAIRQKDLVFVCPPAAKP